MRLSCSRFCFLVVVLFGCLCWVVLGLSGVSSLWVFLCVLVFGLFHWWLCVRGCSFCFFVCVVVWVLVGWFFVVVGVVCVFALWPGGFPVMGLRFAYRVVLLVMVLLFFAVWVLSLFFVFSVDCCLCLGALSVVLFSCSFGSFLGACEWFCFLMAFIFCILGCFCALLVGGCVCYFCLWLFLI